MENPVIKVQLKHSIRIHYVMCATNDAGTTISINGKSLLAIGRLYKIPINFTGNMDEFNVIKLYGKYAEKFDVRNIRDGFAIIQPLVHNVAIQDGEEIGYLL